MKTLKSIIAIVLFVALVQSCTPNDIIEEQIYNQNIEILSIGDEGTIDEDVSKGS